MLSRNCTSSIVATVFATVIFLVCGYVAAYLLIPTRIDDGNYIGPVHHLRFTKRWHADFFRPAIALDGHFRYQPMEISFADEIQGRETNRTSKVQEKEPGGALCAARAFQGTFVSLDCVQPVKIA
jgi:hypothetical protein